jgi:dienelactone hydrolase
MKAAFGLAIILVSSCSFAEEIPFLSGKATTARRNARTPVRIDPIEASLYEGTFDPSKWDDISTTSDKPFQGRQFGSGYAYFEVKANEEKAMFLEAKGDSMVYVNNEPRAGDPYSWGYSSLPVQLKKGKNTFLFAVGRGSFSGKLVDIGKTISFNPSDQTTPDIIKGERENLMVAMIVRNATPGDLDDLTIEAGGVTTRLPRVMGMSIRKVGFQVRPNADGKYKVNLKRGGKVVDSQPLVLRIRDKHQSHKRTFVSTIDGSVQYYAVQPSLSDGAGQALFLSLHGASVEAMGQADAYEPKSWGYIVCPTNRRPYGFDWEDMGRIDALEVFELAKKRYQTDPSQSYLTGHSMGGHGTYQLGVLYPDKFAAIAPCSGWVSFLSYGGGATYPDTPVGNVLKRAMSASDTLSMKSNYLNKPIFIMHGEADDNVPVSEARNMRKELADHPMLYWHEEKGASHWYDTDPEPGSGCEDYAPIFDMFARARIPKYKEVRDFTFKTPNLAASNQCYWMKIMAQDEAGSLSEVHAVSFPGLRKFVIESKNVAAFELDSSVLYGKGAYTVEVNGKAVSTKELGNGWARVDLKGNSDDNQTLCTGFKSVFKNHVTFVIPSADPKSSWARNKARFDAEQLQYIGNGSVDIITEEEYMNNPKPYTNRNLIVYGDAQSVYVNYLFSGGINYSRGGLIPAGGRVCLEAKVQNGRVVGHIYGTDESSAVYGDRIPLFSSGASLPDYLLLDKSFLTDGLKGVFDLHFWSPEKK